MDALLRRDKILKKIIETHEAITGAELAKTFAVSRQVIVQDIALLRASGENIIATPQGYMIPRNVTPKPAVKVFACKHNTIEKMKEELMTIVDFGGKIVDVIIEHPIYGEFRGLLMIHSPAGVRDFISQIKEQNAEPLSALTSGVHLHTVEAESPEILQNIETALKKKGILL